MSPGLARDARATSWLPSSCAVSFKWSLVSVGPIFGVHTDGHGGTHMYLHFEEPVPPGGQAPQPCLCWLRARSYIPIVIMAHTSTTMARLNSYHLYRTVRGPAFAEPDPEGGPPARLGAGDALLRSLVGLFVL